MANILITETTPTISVNTTSNVVTVTNNTSSIVVSNVAVASQETIRTALSVTDAGGDGSLTYSNTTGVFTYTGSSNADKNTWLATRTTDNLAEGSSKLYFTNTRADARVNAVLPNTGSLSEGTNLYYTTARANSAITDFDGILTPSSLTTSGNITTTSNISGGNILGIHRGEVNTTSNISTGGALSVGDGASITGNLNVTGNINSETVTDLFVEDRNITLQFGQEGTPSANSQLFVDRGSSSNTYIKWDEGSDYWKFSNNGSTEFKIPTNTGELAEANTNLYFTTARTNAVIEGYGGNIGPANLTVFGNIMLTNNAKVIKAEVNTDSIQFDSSIIIRGNNQNLTLDDGNILVPQGNLHAANGITSDGVISSGGISSLSSSGVTTAGLISGKTIQATGNGNVGGGGTIVTTAGTGTGNTFMASNSFRVGAKDIQGTAFANAQGTEAVGIWCGHTLGRGNNHDIVFGSKTFDQILDPTSNTEQGNIWYTLSNLNGYKLKIGRQDGITANTTILATGNITSNANVSGANVIGTYLHGNGSNITGLTGDISSVVAGSGLTGGGASGDVTLNVGAGTGIIVNADNIQANMSAFSTSNLAEGTNLYFTTARANSAITAYTGALANLTGNITTTANVSGANFLGNVTGNVTGAPSSLAGLTTANLAENTNLYYTDARFDTRLASKSTSNLTEGTNLYFTTARANSAIGAYTGNLTAVNTTGNIITTANITGGNLLTDHVISASGQPLQLKGQTNGIQLDKTIDSVSSRILDVNTTGYAIAEPTLPATTTLGGFAPSALISINLTNGSNTATARDLYSGALGTNVDVPAVRGPGFNTGFTGGDAIFTAAIAGAPALSGNVEAAFTTAGIGSALGQKNSGLANASASLYGQTKGWTPVNLTDTTELFPIGTFVTGMSGNAITFSQNATGATGTFTLLLNPGIAQTTDANTQLKYQTTIGSNSVINAGTLYGRLGTFDQAETLANLTYDAVSYGNTSSIGFTAVGTKQSADMIVGTESASRYPRLLTVGPSTTPDPFSGRVTTNSPTPIGVTVEDDGHTYAGNNAPYSKFLFNSYTGNFDSLTALPNYVTVGTTGNATLDLPQVKAPSLQFKTFRGAKNTGNTSSYLMQAGEVVGKVSFSPGQTTGAASQGADLVNPPSAITVDVGSANITTVANTHMHITTTPSPTSNGYVRSYETDPANINISTPTLGGSQQTNFTTKGGNLTLAAQTTGMITLAPTPDYGDSANSTVWSRFPGTTHGFHTFLDAKFLTSKQGTLVEIQPKSGTTTGGGSLAYDSSGDSTLRLSSHHANSAVKAQWDITNDQSSGNLVVRSHTSSKNYVQIDTATGMDLLNVGNITGEGGLDISTTSVNPIRILNNGLELAQKTTTEINAISSPRLASMFYNTTLNLIVFYNGSAWRKLNDAAM